MTEDKSRHVSNSDLDDLTIQFKEREYPTSDIDDQLERYHKHSHHHHQHGSSSSKKKNSFFSQSKHSPLEDDASSEPRKVEIKASPALIVLMFLAIAAFIGGILYFKQQEAIQNNSLNELAKKDYENQQAQHEAEKEKEEAEKRKMESDSFYQKLSDGFDVNILLVGDGIASGYGASGDETKWFNVLSEKIMENYNVKAYVKNNTQLGSTAYTSFAKAAALDGGVDYDCILVCLGQHDGAESFAVYYEGLLRALRKKYPKASLVLFLEHSQREYTNKVKMIQRIAEYYSLPVVDMIEPFQEDYDSLVDGEKGSVGYQNDDGNALYANMTMETIDQLVKEKRGFDSEVDHLNELAASFENFQYYPASDFSRSGNTFTLDASFDMEILGVDCIYQSGDTKVNILIDGDTFVDMNVPYDGKQGRRCAIVANDWMNGFGVHCEKLIRIEFEDGEDARADSFKGIVVCGR